MLEHSTRLISENLARALNRRSFLKKAGQASFLGLASLAAGQAFSSSASAGKAPPNISCSPPGPYCNTGGGVLTGCHGAACFQHLYNGQVLQCQVYYTYYTGGCWTSGSSTD